TEIFGAPRTPVGFTGVRVAEARLQTHELQDLADAQGDLGRATAGYDLQFSVRIELGGDPLEDVMGRANGVLTEVIEPPTLW
ncbi:MAG: hypothetical protein ACTSPX_02555, partial [Candidatus Thorarchaeota archaeon]